MTPREKALKRLGVLLRLSQDERSPAGEREAAKLRCEAIQKRWEFTARELTLQVTVDQEARQPGLAARRRQEAIFRAEWAAAAAMSAQRQTAALRLVFVGQPIRMATNHGGQPRNMFVEFSAYTPPDEGIASE